MTKNQKQTYSALICTLVIPVMIIVLGNLIGGFGAFAPLMVIAIALCFSLGFTWTVVLLFDNDFELFDNRKGVKRSWISDKFNKLKIWFNTDDELEG